MSRKPYKVVKAVEAQPDVVYQSDLVGLLIRMLMKDGKHSVSNRIVQNAINNAFDKYIKDEKITLNENSNRNELVLAMIDKVMSNIMPKIEVKTQRFGGANYQVPTPVSKKRQVTLGLRNLIASARSRGLKSMIENLSAEIYDAYKGLGGAVRKMRDTHSMANANKVYANMVRKSPGADRSNQEDSE